jgi:hypothetical protein
MTKEETSLRKADIIDKLEDARNIIRCELKEGRFSIHARFSGGICICELPIETGQLITKLPYCSRWIHEKCAQLELSETKTKSKASMLTEKLSEQAIKKQAIWKDDLVELARLSFLGKWSLDYWIEDTAISVQILDLFGLHKLTRGWRFSSEKTRQKYAQKIEKEFARHKGWICRICRRLIWVEKSVERGIGPVCYKHIQKEGGV